MKLFLATLFSILIIFNIGSVFAQENSDSINEIINKNLQESTDIFVENTKEDIEYHLKKEATSVKNNTLKSFNLEEFINYAKNTIQNFTNYLIEQVKSVIA